MLKRTLSVDAAQVEQLLVVVDKYHQVCNQSSHRVSFACDLPQSMTVVEFFHCFECRGTRGQSAEFSSSLPFRCAFLLTSLSEMKKKKLGLYLMAAWRVKLCVCWRRL